MGIERYRNEEQVYVFGEFDGKKYPFLGEEDEFSLQILEVGEYFRGKLIKSMDKDDNVGFTVVCEDLNRKKDQSFQGDTYKYHIKKVVSYEHQSGKPKENAALIPISTEPKLIV